MFRELCAVEMCCLSRGSITKALAPYGKVEVDRWYYCPIEIVTYLDLRKLLKLLRGCTGMLTDSSVNMKTNK